MEETMKMLPAVWQSQTKQSVRMYESKEHLPLDGEVVIGYSKKYGTYHLCRFNPEEGWRCISQKNSIYSTNRLENLSHWIEIPFSLPYLDEEEEKDDDDD